ncbi:Hypothetical protein GLP15_4913 [Giardia lamblia P15]|uniref:Uncharacterized protein n=1 Tax=Giardia intestinalis (strain P15) TaxID=658858 RepID=E1F9T6_GIAIA|nr:Hypothetical protein GLP15_4913 [Giardia lamblia P15]
MLLNVFVRDADGVTKDAMPEHIILEFQGKFSTLCDANLGNLSLDGDKAWFKTGNQHMEGQVIVLEHPLYVMRKEQDQDRVTGLLRVAKISRRILFDKEPDLISHIPHTQQ